MPLMQKIAHQKKTKKKTQNKDYFMKKRKKIIILARANKKYLTFTLEELEKEAKYIEDKVADLNVTQGRVNATINNWENFKQDIDVDKNKAPLISFIATSAGLFGTSMVAIGVASQGLKTPLVLALPIALSAGAVGYLNTIANIYKPVSLPIAHAYSKFLGDQIEVLNKKKLMVDALMEARVLNKLKGADSAAFDNDPSLTQEQVEFMK